MRITIAGGPMLPIPALDGGSVPRMWQGLAEQFAAKGHRVLVCAKSDPRQPERETLGGVEYRRRGGFRQSPLVWWDIARGLPDAIAGGFALPMADILVTNDFWLPALTPVLRPRAGRVVVNANRYPKHQFSLYGGAAKVVAVSRAVADAIVAQTSTMSDRIEIIPNALDLSVFVGRPKEVAGAELKILYVGRIHPEKGLELLLGAARELSLGRRRLSFRIVGPHLYHQGGGGEKYLDALRSQAAGLPVEFVGPVFELGRLAAFYQQADVFCYPSLAERGESFGIAPLEAMASGVAPIVSALECFSEFIEDGRTGLVFDHRGTEAPLRLAGKIAALDDDRRLLAAVRECAAGKAMSFGFERIAHRYIELFERLLRPVAANGADLE